MRCKSHLFNDWLELGTFAEIHRRKTRAKPRSIKNMAFLESPSPIASMIEHETFCNVPKHEANKTLNHDLHEHSKAS